MTALYATVVTLVALAVATVFGFGWRSDRTTVIDIICGVAVAVAAGAALVAFFAVALTP